ncbi:hypothetical protein PTRG_11106 [Pyrenophora tritici-repentis Pt-1C-BFP]|uniref:Uncharacterized protein n=1 Tax=Pyrenophora tritici-repentis (strain Pt-1C-BFP) TaxID=426418 RepID=B2WM96_PYRTR|nr:uncharacterized protein PTRG_11106 [Pyrenophora tritici-repentis Pt-1C-BFP]EDU44156.1 hypothetical protein PTRG_11106 [Pyrenophora tritici-repentis Pt-1C-BFP]
MCGKARMQTSRGIIVGTASRLVMQRDLIVGTLVSLTSSPYQHGRKLELKRRVGELGRRLTRFFATSSRRLMEQGRNCTSGPGKAAPAGRSITSISTSGPWTSASPPRALWRVRWLLHDISHPAWCVAGLAALGITAARQAEAHFEAHLRVSSTPRCGSATASGTGAYSDFHAGNAGCQRKSKARERDCDLCMLRKVLRVQRRRPRGPSWRARGPSSAALVKHLHCALSTTAALDAIARAQTGEVGAGKEAVWYPTNTWGSS